MNDSEKSPVTLYLPNELVQVLDQRRGRISRSLYVALLLDQAIQAGGLDPAKILEVSA
ncbi:MAG: hypothetical protein ACLP5V_07905 [Candidatus Bathyarchaeia archaeon]